MTSIAAHPPFFFRRQWPLPALACLAAGLCLWGVFGAGEYGSFFRAYLFAWLFFLGLALGGMGLIMAHNLTGGPWCDRPRVVARAASLTLPLLAILFVPLLAGLRDLYPWARPAELAASDTLLHRAGYLNVPSFTIRAALYLILWSAMVILLSRWQRSWQRTSSPRDVQRIRFLSALGLILYVLSITHAGVDWILSRDISFYSTAFGLLLPIGQTLSAFAFAIIILGLPSMRRVLFAEPPSAASLIDVGNILMVLVILWAYVSFMQFLVIWMGNSRDDNFWYIQRGIGQPSAWLWVSLGLIVFHFFIPFFVLLFRAAKRNVLVLACIAWMLLVAHVVEVFWLIAPSGRDVPAFTVSWLDAAAFVAVGGCWLTGFLWLLARRPAEDRVPVLQRAVAAPLPKGAVA